MTYAIIGFGAVGQALASAFARKGIDVAVAGRRAPEALAQQAAAIGPTVTPKPLAEALAADTILLAVPFREHREVAKAAPHWDGKTVIDVTNAFGVAARGAGRPALLRRRGPRLPRRQLVKAFNHLPAAKLAADPSVDGGRRVIFVASDDEARWPRSRPLPNGSASRPSSWAGSPRAAPWSRRADAAGRR